MISRIDRYIAIHILSAIAVVLLIIVGLMGISLYLDELGEVDKHYTSGAAFRYTLLSLPGLAYQLLPLSALVGTLIGMGVLASNSELTVMRAAGVSMMRLILSVAKPISLIAFIALLASQLGVPESQQLARAIKAEAHSESGRVNNGDGGWYRQSGEYIHVSAISPDGQILGVTRHQFDTELRLKQTSFAKKGYYSNERQGWLLEDVELTTLISDQRIEKDRLAEMFWSTELTEEMLRVILVPPVELPISGLSFYSSYLDDQGVDSTSYELALWNKLLQPFSIIALVMIGVAFIFGPLRGVTVGQRIITGVVIGLVFKFSQDLLAPASQVLGFSPLLAALLPIAISFAIALWLLSRVR